MAEFHRKIELQSPDDLQYLVSNIRRAADAEIERNLPRMEDEREDDMRVQVEKIIEQYIQTLLRTTAENITINGLAANEGDMLRSIMNNKSDGTRSIEEHEPFNGKLFNKARDLAVQEEDLIEEIAKLRREVPSKVVEGRKKSYKEAEVGDEDILKGIATGQDNDGGLEIGRLERQDQVESSWNNGVKGLGRMVGSLPESVAKKERAERAEAYVLGKDKR